MRIRATETITDEGRTFAEPGAIGEVLDSDTYKDGAKALTVMFPDAPCVTTVFLGVNVEPLN